MFEVFIEHWLGRCVITTIKEIARRARVSIATVDRVLHNRGRVSPVTEKNVRRILEELDYKPNIFAKHLKLSRNFIFGVLMPKPSQDSMYWTLPARGITRAGESLALQKIQVQNFYYDKHSEASFEKESRETLKSSLDGLLIAPVSAQMFQNYIKEIPPELPYVFFDSFIPDANYISYIGLDSFQSGVLSGRLMELMVEISGTVAVIKMLPQDYHIEDRVSGFHHYCRKCKRITPKIYEVYGHWEAKSRLKVFKRIFEENEKLRGIYVTNASTHQIAEYIRDHYMPDKVPVIGYDLIDKNVSLLKHGVIDFLISQQPEKQGYEGIYTLYKYVLLNEAVKKKIMMPLDIVTKENIDYYQS